ncbi:MAG: DNA polymerase III subunit gamma/tau [bacterium]|nr:DNA polymerase III subunit gamma/tau [bacterium]
MAEALYRKYRPKNFAEVVGQEHIISVLTAAVKNNNTAHAYLFTGSRGTGKTSVARILAVALKCDPADLVEIDAASNRGIGEIRELQEGVRTLPFMSPIKVYVIDEVHMLTKEAFNALLKTLEEPPAHAMFILATTEAGKVPETILSRCEVHHFKPPSVETLEQVVVKIAKSEGFKLAPGVVGLLATLGDGSFRDAIGLLQKVANLSENGEISLTAVERVTAAPSSELLNKIIDGLLENNLDKALAAVNEAIAGGKEMRTLIKLLMRQVRLVMLYGFAPALRAELEGELSAAALIKIKTLTADKAVLGRLSSVLRELLDAYLQTASAAVTELPLELALIKLLTKE